MPNFALSKRGTTLDEEWFVYLATPKDFSKPLDMIDGKVHGTDCFEVDSVSFKKIHNFIEVLQSSHEFSSRRTSALFQLRITP